MKHDVLQGPSLKPLPSTRTDNKVMRLLLKKKLFIYSSTTVWSPSKYIPCACTHLFQRCCHCFSIPGIQPVGCHLRPALQPSGCLLLTQNGVLWLSILLFEVAGCEIRWVRRLQHHHNAFRCQKLHSTANPTVALWICWAPSWHKFFSSPVFQSVSSELFPGSCSLHQQSFWLLISDWIEQVLFPMLCCWWPSVALLIFSKGSAFRKHFVPAKVLCSWHYIISKGLLKFPMCCGGTVTELNTKEIAYRCAMFHASISTTRFTDMSWHIKHELRSEALQSHLTANGDGGRTKVKGCLC